MRTTVYVKKNLCETIMHHNQEYTQNITQVLDDSKRLSREITDKDQSIYEQLISTKLTPAQEDRIIHPRKIYGQINAVLAVHWHPEIVPIPMIVKRLKTAFPNAVDWLVIPTQHNILMQYEGIYGVEVDCLSKEFQRKVQLLIHFAEDKLPRTDHFQKMLNHTFKYRSSQLFEFIDTILDNQYQDRIEEACAKTGATEELVEFVRIHTRKLKKLIDHNSVITPKQSLKNKLIRNYFTYLSSDYAPYIIERAQIFLKVLKKIVKKYFNYEYFYETHEVIEEVRSFGGRIIVPHPEQFWPILLADYAVDGYEVWNPQSQEYTEFLIDVVRRKNASLSLDKRILITMGDDCHLGEKIIDEKKRDPLKAAREVGYQPAWDDPAIQKSLIAASFERKTVINEYKQRLL